MSDNYRKRQEASERGGSSPSAPEQNGRERQRGRADGNGKKKSWFLRHKVVSIVSLSLVLVLVAGACVVASLAGDKGVLLNSSARNHTQEPQGTSAPSGTGTGASVTPGESPSGQDPTPTEEQLPPDYKFPTDIVNILVLGTDTGKGREGEAGRTDCIILVSINQVTSDVSMISIPRDTYVKIYNEKNKVVDENKINVAFRYGMLKSGGDKKVGIAYAVNTIGRFLSGNVNGLIPIDQYVLFDMDMVLALVKAVGGVTIDVKFEMSRKLGDPVDVKPGLQKLGPYEALAYARKRHGVAEGDQVRGQHQQEVMMAVLKEIKNKGTITMIPKLYDALIKYCYTSITPEMVPRFAWIAKDVSIEKIKSRSIKGRTLQISGGSFVIASQDINDPNSKQAILKEIFGIDVKVNSNETYNAVYGAINKRFLAGQEIVNKANALLNGNGDYYTGAEAAALRAAISGWNAAHKKNDEDGMADAQEDVQHEYEVLKAIIDERKATPTPTPTLEPTNEPATPTPAITESPTPTPDPGPTVMPPEAPVGP